MAEPLLLLRLDEPQQWAALGYVERNPVRARLVRLAWRYEWSTPRRIALAEDPSGLLDLPAWRRQRRGPDWQAALRQPADEAQTALLRLCTHTGRPLGSDSFLAKLETLLGRRLRPLPRGRPRKRRN